MADPTFFKAHLLTSFDVRTKGGGVLSPEDGVDRLRQLMDDERIREALMELRIDSNSVVITNLASSAEVEHIEFTQLSQIFALTDPTFAPYDNILSFTMLGDDFQLAPPEMYFFQCLGIPAQRIVDTLTDATSGRRRPSRKSNAGNPGPRSPRSSADERRMRDFEQQAQRSAQATRTYKPGPPPGEMFRQSLNNEDPANEKTQQNIKLLDHCLDDIEKFVHRLQTAADAFHKLEKRRMEREGSYGPEESALIMRAQPPPAQDFINIFQKFKLSFNLLASLKGHIHNPNAPEMIHFLFTPLTLVVDASKDPKTGHPVLADKVVSPLLSSEAIQLLSDCLRSRESELWLSLGDSWSQSRDQWMGQVQPYTPTFDDGWSPPPYWIDDNSVQLPPGPLGNDHSQPVVHRASSMAAEDAAYMRWDRKSSSVSDPNIGEPERPREGKRSSSIYPISEVTGLVDDKQQKYVWELLARKAKIFMLIEPYNAQTGKELTVRKGEIVEVLDDTRNWWSCRISTGQTGFLPRTLLKQYTPSEQPRPVAENMPPHRQSEQHRHSYAKPPPVAGTPYQEPQPPVVQRPAMVVPIVAMGDRRSGAYADPPVVSPRSSVSSNRNSFDGYPADADTYENTTDEAWDEPRSSVSYQRTAVDDLNDEFRKKMSVPGCLVKPQTKPKQVVYLHENSAADEIVHWLQVKGFSSWIQEELSQYDARRLFGLSKAALEQMFGVDEGGRLYSQLLVQRNRSGFKTARSSELQAILKQRKKISDVSLNNTVQIEKDGERF